jgi:CRISPR-associated protein Csd1
MDARKLEKERQRTREMHVAFIRRMRETFPEPVTDAGMAAVLSFLEQGDFEPLLHHPLWPEVDNGTDPLSFRLQGDLGLICQRPAVRQVVSATGENTGQGRCLISGEAEIIARLHPAIKGVWGAQTSGANIVSFNKEAFASYGKEQSFNAPVGERAAFKYTTALNHLLRKGSRQRMQVGDASTVFWAAKDHPVEDDFLDWIEEDRDDPDRHIQAVRALYAAAHTGAQPIDDDDTRFHVLGLAPNAARLAVRFWHVSTVGELARHMRRHFDDIAIEHGPKQPAYLSLFRLLAGTALQGKAENIPPNLAGEVMKAILAGTPYPRTLLTAALRRVRAEREVDYAHAAVIKAVLVRQARFYPSKQQEVGVSLAEQNTNVGYRLGRLFAVLERAQEAANPGINATIRDRFYGAASSTPVMAFPHLVNKLLPHHLGKLENRGQVVNLEKLIGQIMEGIDGFPPHLSLDDQGRFAVGYYHQRQSFYRKKPVEEETVDAE